MTNEPKKQKKYRWLIFGPVWGFIMALIKGVFEPLYFDTPITARALGHDVLLWIPAGIVLGLIMHLITGRKNRNRSDQS